MHYCQNLVVTLGYDVVTYNTIMCYLRETRFFPSTDTSPPVQMSQVSNDNDETILVALCEILFVSVHQLTRLTHLSVVKIYRRLI
jgi:hypothetical protein